MASKTTTKTRPTRQTVASPLLTPTFTKASKIESPPPTSSEISRLEAKLIIWKESMMEEMKGFIRESEQRLLQRVGELTAEIANLKSSYNDMEKRVAVAESECTQLRSDVNALRSQVDECQNNAILTDILLSGVPTTTNEDLGEVFTKICRTVQVNPPSIRTAFRIRKSKNGSSPIIVKLNSPNDRSLLLRAIANFCKNNRRSLALSDIERNGNGKVFVHECLTKRNREVLQHALQLKKQKRLTSVFSLRGDVYVRTRQHSDAVKISDKESAERIAVNNIATNEANNTQTP